jgi:hypothetical protein
MSTEILKITTIFKNSIIKIALILLSSTLISFFYTSSKPVKESYSANVLFELGSINYTYIDGIDVLSVLALSLGLDNISMQQLNNNKHYIIISSEEDNSEKALENIDIFVNSVLNKHEILFNNKVKEINDNISIINSVSPKTIHVGLVNQLLENKKMNSSLKKSKILKDYGVEKIINPPNMVLTIFTGFTIGLMLSLFLVLFQYTFYSDRKI